MFHITVHRGGGLLPGLRGHLLVVFVVDGRLPAKRPQTRSRPRSRDPLAAIRGPACGRPGIPHKPYLTRRRWPLGLMVSIKGSRLRSTTNRPSDGGKAAMASMGPG